MIQDMNTVRITESELARDVHGVLEKVQQGVEFIVEQNHRPVAMVRPPKRSGRLISECIAATKAYETISVTGPLPIPTLQKVSKTAFESAAADGLGWCPSAPV